MTSHIQEQPGVAVLGSGAGAAAGQAVTRLPDLASRSLGGSVVHANDELFAERENLIKPEAPSYSAYTFEHKGQVYDGWETRRRREPGFDHAIVRLGAPGVVRGVLVDTAFFKSNYPPEVSVEGAAVKGHPSRGELQDAEWIPLVPRSPAAGDTRNAFAVDQPQRFTHVRLRMHPDGGVAWLRVHGEVVPDPRFLDPGSAARGQPPPRGALRPGPPGPRGRPVTHGDADRAASPTGQRPRERTTRGRRAAAADHPAAAGEVAAAVSSLSTHVLDAVSGQPAAEVRVVLERRAGDGWQPLGDGGTDADGRLRDLAPDGLDTGDHRLVLATGDFFAATGRTGSSPRWR